ncbi:MAG: hypothetical protein NW215_06245 [Hyphomicrobiales bacterium]|nr:hypothetical protein [Hyphomicrobiales bacterium]
MSGRALIIAAFAVTAALLALLHGLASERWFDLYGGAAAVLAGAPVLQAGLWRGLKAGGRSPWLSLVVTAPMVIVAAAQIGFWWGFYAGGEAGVTLGVVRGALWTVLGPYAWAIAGLYLSLCAFIVARAAAVRRTP